MSVSFREWRIQQWETTENWQSCGLTLFLTVTPAAMWTDQCGHCLNESHPEASQPDRFKIVNLTRPKSDHRIRRTQLPAALVCEGNAFHSVVSSVYSTTIH